MVEPTTADLRRQHARVMDEERRKTDQLRSDLAASREECERLRAENEGLRPYLRAHEERARHWQSEAERLRAENEVAKRFATAERGLCMKDDDPAWIAASHEYHRARRAFIKAFAPPAALRDLDAGGDRG